MTTTYLSFDIAENAEKFVGAALDHGARAEDVSVIAYPGVLDKDSYDVAKQAEKVQAPEAKQQLAGWKVIKAMTPNPDGSIVYIHIISPVVKEADYSIMNNIYAAVKDPAEQKAVFDMYRGAMKQALFVIQGPLVADLSK